MTMPTDDMELDQILDRFANYVKRYEQTGLEHPMDSKAYTLARISEYVARKQVEARVDELERLPRGYHKVMGYNQMYTTKRFDEVVQARLEQLQGESK